MPIAAATATPGIDPLTALALFVIVVTVGYILLCAVWPFTHCRRCRGAGRHRGPLRGIRLCHRCQGSGLRLRWGRRVWNSTRRLYREVNGAARGERAIDRARTKYGQPSPHWRHRKGPS